MNNGHDGFLAANDKEWEQALTLLIEQPERRLQIGENARRNVLQHYNAQARAKDLSAILPSLMNKAANK
jgi:spore maturation protein CgeB